MRNIEGGIQIIGPNLNGLGPNIQWIGLLGSITIWHHSSQKKKIIILFANDRLTYSNKDNY